MVRNISDWTVRINNTLITFGVQENGNYSYVFFTYAHSTKTVQIVGMHAIPEFPSFLILPLFMIATLLAVIVYIKIRKKQ